MLLSEKVVQTWNSRNKDYYTSKGYSFSKIGNTFIVNVEDLSNGSHVEVEVLCDYCFKNVIIKPFKSHINQGKKGIIKKDCCFDCKGIKTKESNLLVYGKDNVFQVEEYKEKHKNTIKVRYGIENVSQLEDHIEKSKITMLMKYGEEHYSKTDDFKTKFKNTCLERYGVSSPLKNKEIKAKAMRTLYENGTCATSSQQLEIFKLLKEKGYSVELNYPVSNVSLDVAFFIGNLKIDIEYDGIFWHQDTQKDRKRDEFLKNEGWKILRIRSRRKIPEFIDLKNAIDKLINSDKKFIQIILDDVKEVI